MLTPMDIHDHQFKKSFRGYSENEVDDFLDKVVVDFERLLNENERLKNQLYSTETELEKYRGLEKTMNDTLIVAQRTADEVISAAKKNADMLKEQAARECQQVKDEAQLEGKKLIDAAAVKRDALLAEYSGLIRERNTFLVKMRTILESELAITNHVIESLPSFEEVQKSAPPEEKISEEKISEPVDEPAPEEKSSPEEKISEPEEKSAPEEIEDTHETNIVDVSTKPVTDETKTYKPVFGKESSK